ncbi:Hypothetical predicted protein [Cloeon dipterum]|uniref:Uncharacterized protein n=1 Tax=Cloeon dipterum TaxID=197152 RepID=A0A8S1DZ25_9INSE|nr:Hypothetical predicted protein [Cloeon dipterum]
METKEPLRWRRKAKFIDSPVERVASLASFSRQNFSFYEIWDLPPEDRSLLFFRLMGIRCLKPIRNTEEFQTLMLPAFKQVLHTNTTVLDLTGFVSFFPKLQRVALTRATIFRISDFAPNLKELIIKRDRDLREDPHNNYLSSDEEVLDALCQLKKLIVLQMEVLAFDLPDLLTLGKQLPKLKYLSTNVTKKIEMNSVKELKMSFKQLKVFLFCSNADWEKRQALRRLIIKSLKQIQVVEDFSSQLCATKDWFILPELGTPGESDLRHLTLDYDLGPKPADLHLKYPRVTHLKLEKLCLVGRGTEEKIDSFAQLKELNLSLSFGCFGSNSPTLFNLLSAPDLKKLELLGQFKDVEDLRMLTSMIKTGRIFLNLENLVVNFNWFTLMKITAKKEIYFKQTVEFLFVAMNYLGKRLTQIKFCLNDCTEYTQLARCLKENATEKEMERISSFYRGANSENLGWIVNKDLIAMLEKRREE